LEGVARGHEANGKKIGELEIDPVINGHKLPILCQGNPLKRPRRPQKKKTPRPPEGRNIAANGFSTMKTFKYLLAKGRAQGWMRTAKGKGWPIL